MTVSSKAEPGRSQYRYFLVQPIQLSSQAFGAAADPYSKKQNQKALQCLHKVNLPEVFLLKHINLEISVGQYLDDGRFSVLGNCSSP